MFHDINYGLSEVQDESIFYESDCNECESKFHEHYTLKFSGMSLMVEKDGIHKTHEMEVDDIILNERRKTTDETKKA